MDRIATLIEVLTTLAAADAEVPAFLPGITDLVAAAPLSIGSRHEPGVIVYRGTRHHQSLPLRVEELWFPPADRAPLGRANRAGTPMFYCTSDPAASLLEISIKTGDLAVQATWVTTGPMLLHAVGYSPAVFTRAGSKRLIPEHHQAFYKDRLNADGIRVREFLSLAFTDPGASSYALTAAIAEFHVERGEFSGLIYPAVAKAANTDNLALTPAFVWVHMKLQAAQLLKVDTVIANGDIGGVILADLTSVEDGRLNWKFRETGVPVPPKGSYALKSGDAVIATSAAEIEMAGSRFRVEPGYSISVSVDGKALVKDLRGEPVAPTLDTTAR